MNIITHKTPGLLPLPNDFTGLLVAQAADCMTVRKRHPKLQVLHVVGGNGAIAGKLGSGVFVNPLWMEAPEGSGTLRRLPDTEAHDEGWKDRRANLLGVVSDELLRAVEQTPDTIPPGDPNDLCVMVAHDGHWAKGSTVREALTICKLRGVGAASVAVVHREAWIDDMGGLHTPLAYVVEGRPAVQWVSGGRDDVRRTLPAAEKYAAELIAAARG